MLFVSFMFSTAVKPLNHSAKSDKNPHSTLLSAPFVIHKTAVKIEKVLGMLKVKIVKTFKIII